MTTSRSSWILAELIICAYFDRVKWSTWIRNVCLSSSKDNDLLSNCRKHRFVLAVWENLDRIILEVIYWLNLFKSNRWILIEKRRENNSYQTNRSIQVHNHSKISPIDVYSNRPRFVVDTIFLLIVFLQLVQPRSREIVERWMFLMMILRLNHFQLIEYVRDLLLVVIEVVHDV